MATGTNLSNTDTGQDDGELRILLIGRTGSGKSSTGNSILKYKDTDEGAFGVSGRSTSYTRTTEMKEADQYGFLVTVVDTPGLYDTKREEKEIRKELLKALATTTPGFHVIVFVMKPEKYTEELKKTQEKFFEWFGKGVEKHALVVLTHTANKAQMDEYLSETDPKLKELIRRCNNTILPIDNKGNAKIKNVQLQNLIKKMCQIKKHCKHFTNINYRFAEIYARSRTTNDFQEDSLLLLSQLGLSRGNLRMFDANTEMPISRSLEFDLPEGIEYDDDDDVSADDDVGVNDDCDDDDLGRDCADEDDDRVDRCESIASGYKESKIERNCSKLPGTEETNNDSYKTNQSTKPLILSRESHRLPDFTKDNELKYKDSFGPTPGNLQSNKQLHSEKNPSLHTSNRYSLDNGNEEYVGSEDLRFPCPSTDNSTKLYENFNPPFKPSTEINPPMPIEPPGNINFLDNDNDEYVGSDDKDHPPSRPSTDFTTLRGRNCNPPSRPLNDTTAEANRTWRQSMNNETIFSKFWKQFEWVMKRIKQFFGFA